MANTSNHKRIKNLLEQIIVKATSEDILNKQLALADQDYNYATGESWMLYHLKLLKELIEENDNSITDK